MRLALLIKTVGTEPVLFEHTDFRSYKKDLKKQYAQLRPQLDSKTIAQAEDAVQELLCNTSLSAAAGELVPLYPLTPERTTPNNRLRRQCRWKLVHTNFLSALHHPHQLSKARGETNLRIYPCLVC
jgi:hypothetical protein